MEKRIDPIIREYEELGKHIQYHIDVERSLRERLYRLTGCPNFGGCDGMNGSCHYCSEEDPDIYEKCWQFTFEKEKG